MSKPFPSVTPFPVPRPRRRGRGGFTMIEVIVAAGLLVGLATSAHALLLVINRRLTNERSRHLLAAENARAAHVISELARRAVRVRVLTDLSSAASGAAPTYRGDVLAFDLPDGSSRWVAWENGGVELFYDLSQPPAVLSGEEAGRTVTRIGADAHCDYAQGLPRAAWLARASTPQGWTEEITYSAFAVPLHGR